MKYAKIKSIKKVGCEDVYNMEVKDNHNFAISKGLIIHNCMDAMRYMIASLPANPFDMRNVVCAHLEKIDGKEVILTKDGLLYEDKSLYNDNEDNWYDDDFSNLGYKGGVAGSNEWVN